MAITVEKLADGKHAVVETNHVSAVRTGNIAAQYVADVKLDNGMALSVDHSQGKVKLAVDGQPVYLHASDEQLYEDHVGRDAFYIKEGEYPKALLLEVGDIFETDAVAVDTYNVGDAVGPMADGLWGKVPTVKNIEAVVAGTVYLPNGKAGLKIAITKVASASATPEA